MIFFLLLLKWCSTEIKYLGELSLCSFLGFESSCIKTFENCTFWFSSIHQCICVLFSVFVYKLDEECWWAEIFRSWVFNFFQNTKTLLFLSHSLFLFDVLWLIGWELDFQPQCRYLIVTGLPQKCACVWLHPCRLWWWWLFHSLMLRSCWCFQHSLY